MSSSGEFSSDDINNSELVQGDGMKSDLQEKKKCAKNGSRGSEQSERGPRWSQEIG